MSSQLRYYVVVGRREGDDEASVHTFEAENRAEAIELFTEAVWDGDSAEEREAHFNSAGKDCFIDAVFVSSAPIEEANDERAPASQPAPARPQISAMTNTQKLDAIKARLQGQFHHPEMLMLGELMDDKYEDILHILALPDRPDTMQLVGFVRDDTPLPVGGEATIYVRASKLSANWLPVFARATDIVGLAPSRS